MNVVIFIAVFFSSIVGLQFFGVSVNKLALIPLEIYLIVRRTDARGEGLLQRRALPVMLWYGVIALSSVSGLIFLTFYGDVYLTRAYHAGISNLIQIAVFYIPITVLLYKKCANGGEKVGSSVSRAFVVTARIQCCWALAQTALYYGAQYDLNGHVFNGLLGQTGRWTLYSNMVGKNILLRPTGLNHDAAFLGMIMILGIVLDRVKLWKTLYVPTILIASSRSALVTVIGLAVYVLFYTLLTGRKKGTSTTKSVIAAAAECMAIAILLIVVLNIPAVQNQITRMSDRMATISNGEDGTQLHMGYPVQAVEIVLFRYPLLQKLFGIGIDVSGTALNIFSSVVNGIELTEGMMSSVWSIECDFAGILLGTGLVGAGVYYSLFVSAYIRNRDLKSRSVIIALLIYGIMYNYAWLTVFQILLWTLLITAEPAKKSVQQFSPIEKHMETAAIQK